MEKWDSITLLESSYEDARQHLIKQVLAPMIEKKDYLVSAASTKDKTAEHRMLKSAAELETKINIVGAFVDTIEQLMRTAFDMTKNEYSRGFADAEQKLLPAYPHLKDKELERAHCISDAMKKWPELYEVYNPKELIVKQ